MITQHRLGSRRPHRSGMYTGQRKQCDKNEERKSAANQETLVSYKTRHTWEPRFSVHMNVQLT